MTDKKQNEVSESKEIPHEINSVSDLSRILKRLGKPGQCEEPCELKKSNTPKKPDNQEKEKTRFFRGHGDADWDLLPGIYRKGQEHLIVNEDKIIKDALTYCPDDFLPSDTLFEKLVKLQHYGYSTRLLDLTTNALVALYFAAQPYKEKKPYSDEYSKPKDGELIILDIPDEEVKYWDSDTVSVISAISLQNESFNLLELINRDDTLYKNNLFFEKACKAALFKNMISTVKKINKEEGKKIEKYYNSLPKEEAFVLIKSFFNSQPETSKLLHTIRADKPSFHPVIDPRDLQRVLCVRAKLNNARISRQQGCFLLFGIGGNKTEAAAIPTEWHPSALKNQKILVKADSKSTIRQELESFGISKRTLFPELEAQATEIMNHYKGHK